MLKDKMKIKISFGKAKAMDPESVVKKGEFNKPKMKKDDKSKSKTRMTRDEMMKVFDKYKDKY